MTELTDPHCIVCSTFDDVLRCLCCAVLFDQSTYVDLPCVLCLYPHTCILQQLVCEACDVARYVSAKKHHHRHHRTKPAETTSPLRDVVPPTGRRALHTEVYNANEGGDNRGDPGAASIAAPSSPGSVASASLASVSVASQLQRPRAVAHAQGPQADSAHGQGSEPRLRQL
jgi:hypothetical protein